MIKVFVGCAPNHEDAESQAVLEWSIKKHCSEPFKIEWMKLSRDPASPWYSDGDKGWQTKQWATPFSGFRWVIPNRCGYNGKGIYMDSDVIVLEDLAELWHQEIPEDKFVLAKGGGSWRYCVSMWNCKAFSKQGDIEKLKSDPSSHSQMVQFMSTHPSLTSAFEGDWNCCDGGGKSLSDPSIKALHYTDMSTQPHLRYAVPRLAKEGRSHWFNGTFKMHPRNDIMQLFDKYLSEAAQNGYTVKRYCQDSLYGEINKKSLINYQGSAS